MVNDSIQVTTEAKYWKCGTLKLALDRPLIMGIVNVTPDSFSDGGTHNSVEAAIAWGHQLVREGADILDVGGESTRPGAALVTVEEELARVIPVVKALVEAGYCVSVDTSKPEVMRAAIAVGAQIINDVRALETPGALEAVADSDVGVVIMHMRGTPQTMQNNTEYFDVVADVESYLRDRQAVLEAAGISKDRICWDPGFGFGKDTEGNFQILKATARFVASGQPFLMGLSRKRSLGEVTGVGVASERVTSSVVASLLSIQQGAHVVRVHDVKPMREALDVWQAYSHAQMSPRN